MLNEQARTPRTRPSVEDFAALPRNRVRAIMSPGSSALPARSGFKPMPSPIAPSAAPALAPGTITSRHVGRLRTAAALKALPATVRKGERIATIEALGMVHEVCAPRDGLVVELLTPCGEACGYGQPVARMANA